jgi:hypothetical protein
LHEKIYRTIEEKGKITKEELLTLVKIKPEELAAICDSSAL